MFALILVFYAGVLVGCVITALMAAASSEDDELWLHDQEARRQRETDPTTGPSSEERV